MPFADLTDVRCYYEVHGRGDPILMIPGLGATCQDWEPQWTRFTDGFALIQPDLRGMGQSTARRQPGSLHHYSADLVELLDHLHLDRVHVVGISLGGLIAQRFAIDHPERVRRLVLVSCAHKFGPRLREIAALVGGMLRRFRFKQFVRSMELLISGPVHLDANPQRLDEKEAQAARNGVSRKGMVRQLRCMAVSDPDGDEHSRITAPTLVMSGEYDMLIPHCYGRQMARVIDDSRFMLLRDVGHNPFKECPDLVLPAIAQFLRGGEPVIDPLDDRYQSSPTSGPDDLVESDQPLPAVTE